MDSFITCIVVKEVFITWMVIGVTALVLGLGYLIRRFNK